MAKSNYLDFSQLEKAIEGLEEAIEGDVLDQFMRDFLVEMAYRIHARTIKRTPVHSGELRRNWQVGKVERVGEGYVVELFNNTDYASFVEFGHRTGDNLTEWNEGKFMMTMSIEEVQKELPRYFDQRVQKLFDKLMKG
ncbi:MAG: HK97 gp10 family phage protein [Candidatus Pristimantibacillus sp.]